MLSQTKKLKLKVEDLETKIENLEAEKENMQGFYKDKIQIMKKIFDQKTRRLKAKSSLMENQFDVHEKWQNNAKKDIINSHIPYTRVINQSLSKSELEKFIEERNKYVLKIADGASGHEILIGIECDSESWCELISEVKMGKRSYVIQEFVESVPFTYLSNKNQFSKHNLVWGFFVFGEKYAGSVLRTSDKNDRLVINSYLNKGTKKGYMLELSY